MRRTTTLRALAGVGSAAVLMAFASPALAEPSPPFDQDWAETLEAQGHAGVSCYVSVMPGTEGSDTIYLEERIWEPVLQEDSDWLLVVLKAQDGTEDEMQFAGYGIDNPYQVGSGSNITHVLACEGGAEGAAPTGEITEEPTEEATEEEPTEEATEEATEEPTGEATEADDPTGPPVETDGPARESGPSMGLMGGAALALAGAGVAGLALRRRDGARH